MNRSDIYNQITQCILSNLIAGVLPWRKPWINGIPQNYFSKYHYNGLNFLLLSLADYPEPYYLTFLQASKSNLKIKSGSKGNLIVFYKIMEVHNDEEASKYPLLRYSYVFNISQLENYNIPDPQLSSGKELLNQIIGIHNPIIKNNCTSSFFEPAEDYISIPVLTRFNSEEEYFSALFHEMVHWSGHHSRLNRSQFKKWGDDIYSFEELIAEIGSSYLCGLCGFQNVLNNQSSYLNSWLKSGQMDNSFIPQAAIHAQKAVNYLLNKSEYKDDANACLWQKNSN